jgi:hypothetical protein
MASASFRRPSGVTPPLAFAGTTRDSVSRRLDPSEFYVPFPLSETVCGLPASLSVTVSAAFRTPVVVGVNFTANRATCSRRKYVVEFINEAAHRVSGLSA